MHSRVDTTVFFCVSEGCLPFPAGDEVVVSVLNSTTRCWLARWELVMFSRIWSKNFRRSWRNLWDGESGSWRVKQYSKSASTRGMIIWTASALNNTSLKLAFSEALIKEHKDKILGVAAQSEYFFISFSGTKLRKSSLLVVYRYTKRQ